jgi:sortase A
MRFTFRRVLILALIFAGVWQISSALYIYAKASLAQRLISNAWVQTLEGQKQVRPWPWADTWPVARLVVPASNVDLYVLSDASGRTLAFGPGVLSGTAMLGSAGNTVIAAHRDTHFRFLRDVKVGTELSLQLPDGRWHRYALIESAILDSRHDRLRVDSPHPTLTLMTCYPFDAIVPGGPLRYAAVAELRF